MLLNVIVMYDNDIKTPTNTGKSPSDLAKAHKRQKLLDFPDASVVLIFHATQTIKAAVSQRSGSVEHQCAKHRQFSLRPERLFRSERQSTGQIRNATIALCRRRYRFIGKQAVRLFPRIVLRGLGGLEPRRNSGAGRPIARPEGSEKAHGAGSAVPAPRNPEGSYGLRRPAGRKSGKEAGRFDPQTLHRTVLQDEWKKKPAAPAAVSMSRPKTQFLRLGEDAQQRYEQLRTIWTEPSGGIMALLRRSWGQRLVNFGLLGLLNEDPIGGRWFGSSTASISPDGGLRCVAGFIELRRCRGAPTPSL